MAKRDLGAIRRAVLMQADAVRRLMADYESEPIGPTSLEGLTYDSFLSMWEEAEKNGDSDEFNAQVAELLLPALTQMMGATGNAAPAGP